MGLTLFSNALSFSFGELSVRSLVAVFALIVITLCFVRATLARNSLYRSSPPGPSGLPFIGNVFDIPQERPWVAYRDLAATYGDVIAVKALGQTLIVLNSLSATIDLLEKRSAMYSDRPVSVVSQMIGWTRNLAFKQYGDDWRAIRRMLWQHIQPGVVAKYQPVQHRGAVTLLKHLYKDSSNLDEQIKSSYCKILLNVTYGHRFDHAGTPRYIEILSQLESALAEAFQPGAFLVEFIPWLRHVPQWFPGAGWKQKVLRWKGQLDSLVEEPYQAANEAMRRGEAEQSMLSEAMDSIGREKDPSRAEYANRLIKEATSSAFHGNLAAILHAFVCAIVLNPKVQIRAQEELDRVVGCDRLPEHSDRPSLPYVEAILKETYRWHNPVPLGVAHRCSEDNVYRGWKMPKGAAVMFNVWAMLQDPEVFSEPEVFRPERFLEDGKLNLNMMQPEILTFGVGRRVCPGKHFADDSLFISIACILHVFTITKALDALGAPIPVKAEITPGILSFLKQFDCSIRPRSTAHEALVQEA
ncbi:cytochrome P450 [Cubamyces menziesii]|nr:cytochrome P450 [Cubamyces menziesii]